MSVPYHYPSDLFELLIDAISRLYKSKEQVFGFFCGAGVPDHYSRDIEQRWRQNPQDILKADIAREILQRLKEEWSDRALETRRNVIVRVIATEDYNTCWENASLPAQGAR